MSDMLTSINLRHTPQSVQADPRQKANNAGGFTFTLDAEARLRRFLILGTDAPTYYSSAADLTRDNAGVVIDFARTDASRLVDIVVEISLAGRAPKQNQAIFALAAAASLGDDKGRRAAIDFIEEVCRTGTHLFLFIKYVEQFRGWGRGLRRGVSNWYLSKDAGRLAYQVLKYRQREGWTHRDALRKAHPKTDDAALARLFDWICGREVEGELPELVDAFQVAQASGAPATWVKTIDSGLSWEMLPDAALSNELVWQALIERGMPMTALIRQLPRLTRLGVTRNMRAQIVSQLTDADRLTKARVHPVNVLNAMVTYASGQSGAGKSTWTPDRKIIDALDSAFYESFGTVVPANKRTLVALDVSGSMDSRPLDYGRAGLQMANRTSLSAREISSAMAMVTLATEPDVDIVGFTGSGGFWRRNNTELTELSISPRQRLDDVIRTTSRLDFGATDCALPMVWALKAKRAYDTFVIWTDNETWVGGIHPHQALKQYRDAMGIDAKLVVCGVTATEFSIADPSDAGMLDVVGFDSAVPTLISDFSRGL